MPFRSDRLRALRAETGISQARFSKALGLGGKTFTGFENNPSDITAHSLEMLALIFRVSVNYLLGLSDDRDVQFSAEALTRREALLGGFTEAERTALDRALSAQEEALLAALRRGDVDALRNFVNQLPHNRG